MPRQTTSHLLMIRPVQFAFNIQTAGNNAFQSTTDANAQDLALKEFDEFVILLRANEINVTVIDDTPYPHTPDSIFPNNWISFHENGSIVLYPMFAENRRKERKDHVLSTLAKNFIISNRIDLSSYETNNTFLEGTGSMVLDRENKIAYACLSARTDKDILNDFCTKLGFTGVTFSAMDENDFPIYHTNVMMCVAEGYVIICLDSIKNDVEKESVINILKNTNKKIISISLDQMNHFAGNMLQVNNANGKRFLVMSSQAHSSLTDQQIELIENYNTILHSSLETIERNGGGSARCMMAEVFLKVLPC